MWIVKHIFDGDFGCEERLKGEPLMVLVTLESDEGRTTQINVSDEWLWSNGIDEGDEWPYYIA